MDNTSSSGPDYTIRFEQRPEYLYCYVELHISTYDTMLKYCQQIAAAALASPTKKLLVEKAAAEMLSTADAYRLASELPGLGFNRVRIAFVDHAPNTRDLNDFTELVGNNRGLNVKTFASAKEAEAWLLGR